MSTGADDDLLTTDPSLLATDPVRAGELGTGGDERPGPALRAARFVGRCLPLIAGAGLFAHLAWFGLRPALMEQDRLERAGADVHARRAALEAEYSSLELRRAALDDPFYRERLRRAQRAAEREARAEVTAAAARNAATGAGAPAAGSAPTDGVDTSGRERPARRSLVR